ncbi:MAG: TIGR00341 family protein [Halodesulfurarchaeum sp.]
MRLVQVTIPAGKRSTVIATLEKHDIDYVMTDETSNRDIVGVVYFPLPTEAVEDVLDDLRAAGLERDAYTVVMNAETVISRRFEKLQATYEEAAREDAPRIAREELEAAANDLSPNWTTFVVLSVVSAIVATAGLLLNSPAVVVGSMVIAPLIGPAMETSVGSVLADRDRFLEGVKLQLAGFGLAIAAAAVFAAIARYVHLVPPGLDVLAIDQIRGRLSPDFLSLAVALGAGVAGALSLSAGISSALVGVMIAAALIPPTAVIGIGIAWTMPQAVLGSSVLVLVNVLSINLAALAVLWYQGYRPSEWFHLEEARSGTLKRIGALVLAILVLSAFLGATTYSTYQTATFENDARNAVEDVLSTSQYEDLRLIETQFAYEETVPFRRADLVVIRLGLPPGTGPPEQLPERIATAIESETGRSVEVQIRYVTVQTT